MDQQLPLIFNNARVQTFDTFNADGNKQAVSVLEKPFNHHLLYIYGCSYSGKTHLLKSVKSQCEGKNIPVQIVSSSMLNDEMLLQVLPDVPLYIIDNLEQVAGNENAEKNLFNLYNNTHANGTSIITAARIDSCDKRWCLPDLVSRLNGGYKVKVNPLYGEGAFLVFFCMIDQAGIDLNERTRNYIKVHSRSDLPHLCLLLQLLNQYTLSRKKKVNIGLVKSILNNIHQSSKTPLL